MPGIVSQKMEPPTTRFYYDLSGLLRKDFVSLSISTRYSRYSWMIVLAGIYCSSIFNKIFNIIR